MEQTRKRMKFEILLERLFSNFHRIIFTNLLFFIPLSVLALINYLVRTYFNSTLSNVLSIAFVVLIFSFYSGVVLVCRNIARGDEGVRVFSVFIKGLKENFLKFLLFGLFFAFVSVFSYFSISMYSKLLTSSWVFYALMFVCILIALLCLFMFFYIPLMTVTFELSLKNIFKNSFLMSFGEIKNNFFALISLAVVVAIAFTIVAFCTQVYLLVIVTVLLVALIIPATCEFVVSFFVYDDMYASIADKSAKSEKISQAISDAKSAKQQQSFEVDDYSDVDISSLKDTDDYIFYKGKMMKQSVLLRLALQQEHNKNNNEDV